LDNSDSIVKFRQNGDNAGAVATGTVNPDSVGDIGQDNSSAGVGATDPDDSDSGTGAR